MLPPGRGQGNVSSWDISFVLIASFYIAVSFCLISLPALTFRRRNYFFNFITSCI